MDEKKKMHPALLIAFSEYLGYVSPYIDYALSVCKGEKVEKEVSDFLEVEAKAIFRDMQQNFTEEELMKWYKIYEPIIFAEYIKNLEKNA